MYENYVQLWFGPSCTISNVYDRENTQPRQLVVTLDSGLDSFLLFKGVSA